MKPLSNSGAARARQFLGKATRLPLLGALAIGLLAPAAHAVTPISFAGTYSQDFNTLPITTPPAFTGKGPFDVPTEGGGTLPGWQFSQIAGSGANVNFKAEAGTTSSGSLFSYGADASSERALGALASGSLTGRIGAIFVNNSTTTYSNFTINYNGEQWRVGGTNAVNNTFAFNYDIVAAQPADIGGMDVVGTAFAGLDFNTPVDSGPSAAVDGNSETYRVPVTGTVTGLSWAPGQFLVIRFDDVNDASSDHGIAVDDFSMTAGATAVQTNPVVTNGTATPSTLEQGQQTLLTVEVTPGANPTSTGITVIGNLSVIGGSATQEFFDDGTNGDETAGNGVYSYLATVAADATVGTPTIAVRVSDAQSRADTTSINLTVNARSLPSTTLVISEFRPAGPGGSADEFIELLNISNAPIDVAGYQLFYGPSSGSGPNSFPLTFSTTNTNTVVPAGGRFLLANAGASQAVLDIANATYNSGIAADGGIGIADAAGTLLDRVGQSAGTILKEGTPVTAAADFAGGQSYERLELSVNTQDTQDNASDFTVSTAANPQGLPAAAANNAPVLSNMTFTAGINVPFSAQLMGTDPDAGDTLTYAMTDALPAGLTLSADGVISGTPTVAGVTRFTATVSDGRGGTTTAKFAFLVRDLAAGTDTVAPVTTRNAIPSSTTRVALAAMSLSGTTQDVAQSGVTASGVKRVLVQLRTGDSTQAYNGSAFTTNLKQGYYAATVQDGALDAERTYNRPLSFLPSDLAAGNYLLLLYPQDNVGNYTAEFIPFAITAPAAPANSSEFATSQAPSTGSDGSS